MFLNSGHSPGKLIDTGHPSEVLRQRGDPAGTEDAKNKNIS